MGIWFAGHANDQATSAPDIWKKNYAACKSDEDTTKAKEKKKMDSFRYYRHTDEEGDLAVFAREKIVMMQLVRSGSFPHITLYFSESVRLDITDKDAMESFLAWYQLDGPASDRPTIVCLCGSTRFMDAFREANLRETLAGRIVLSVGIDTKSDADLLLAGVLTSADKERVDVLHLRKIDLADEVLILNVGGYIGSSTRNEIVYAHQQGKRIRWLEKPLTDEEVQ